MFWSFALIAMKVYSLADNDMSAWMGLHAIIHTIIMGKMEMVLPDMYMINRFMGICFRGPSATSQHLYTQKQHANKNIKFFEGKRNCKKQANDKHFNYEKYQSSLGTFHFENNAWIFTFLIPKLYFTQYKYHKDSCAQL